MHQVRTSNLGESSEASSPDCMSRDAVRQSSLGRLPASWFVALSVALTITIAKRAFDGEAVTSLERVPNFDINVNSAEPAEISALPRVGKGLATRVVEHRAAVGGFESIEQLAEVPRIGEKTISRLSNYLTTESK